jgi:hypothetical protein
MESFCKNVQLPRYVQLQQHVHCAASATYTVPAKTPAKMYSSSNMYNSLYLTGSKKPVKTIHLPRLLFATREKHKQVPGLASKPR